MKNIYEEAFQLIYDDFAKKDRHWELERTTPELGSDFLDKLDPSKPPFYVTLAETKSSKFYGRAPGEFTAKVIFLHDVSDLNLSNLEDYTLTDDKIKLIKERLKEHSEYTDNVLELLFSKEIPALEKVPYASVEHYAISNSGQPGEVTQYRCCSIKIIDIEEK